MVTESQPKYVAIADDLAAAIQSGEHPARQPLPAQRQLADRYGVSLMTLRHAIALLVDKGMLLQVPGSGTYVVGASESYQVGPLRSFPADLREQGLSVTTFLVEVARSAAPAAVRSALRLSAPRARVLRIERVRQVQGRPSVHQVSWVHPDVADQVGSADLGVVSLYDALAAAGVQVHRAEETLQPVALGEAEAGLLRRPVGQPAFRSERITMGALDAPVLVDYATIVGDTMALRTSRSASRLDVRWAADRPATQLA